MVMSMDHVFYFPPHQDDELTNFGAAILKDIAAGYDVRCVLCTDGGASSARSLIGNGEECCLHPGRHDHRLTVPEFCAARDREYKACCRELGLEEENIIISPLRGRDGALTVAQARAIILDAIRGLEPEKVTVKTLAPIPGPRSRGRIVPDDRDPAPYETAIDQNPDHTATGAAARELFKEGAFGHLVQFFESIHLDAAGNNAAGLRRITPDEVRREKYIKAAGCYGIWDPENGFYAVGHHSVKDEFDMMTNDPVSWVAEEFNA